MRKRGRRDGIEYEFLCGCIYNYYIVGQRKGHCPKCGPGNLIEAVLKNCQDCGAELRLSIKASNRLRCDVCSAKKVTGDHMKSRERRKTLLQEDHLTMREAQHAFRRGDLVEKTASTCPCLDCPILPLDKKDRQECSGCKKKEEYMARNHREDMQGFKAF